MPLKKGSSKKTMEDNYKELKKAHPDWPHKKIVAVMLNKAGKSKKG
jgi:hypothetical protein